MNKIKKADLTFVILVFLFLLIPNIYINQEKISTKENRTLATHKHLFIDKKVNTDFGKNFEAFYNDRFFTRDFLLSLYAKLSKVFMQNEYVNSNVFIGNDNWLFFKFNDAYLDYANANFFTETELKQIAQYLSSIDNWCKKNKKEFVFFIAPNKHRIYEEYFPKQIKKINPNTQSKAFKLINFLNANTNIRIVYPYEALIKEKQNGNLLYWKNDTHWNELGAYIGYKELCKELKIEPYKIADYKETFHTKGDLTNMLLSTTQNDDYTAYKVPDIQKNYSEISISEQNYSNNTIYTTNNGKTLNAVFYRDSFSTNLIPYVSNSFNKVQYKWTYGISEEDLDALTNADIVMLEIVERNVPDFIDLKLPSFILQEN